MRLRPTGLSSVKCAPGKPDIPESQQYGHPGSMCTLHANSARGGLIRLEQLIQEAIPTPQQALIAEAIISLFISNAISMGAGSKRLSK